MLIAKKGSPVKGMENVPYHTPKSHKFHTVECGCHLMDSEPMIACRFCHAAYNFLDVMEFPDWDCYDCRGDHLYQPETCSCDEWLSIGPVGDDFFCECGRKINFDLHKPSCLAIYHKKKISGMFSSIFKNETPDKYEKCTCGVDSTPIKCRCGASFSCKVCGQYGR